VPRPYSVGKCVVHDGDLERFPFVSEEWGYLGWWVVSILSHIGWESIPSFEREV